MGAVVEDIRRSLEQRVSPYVAPLGGGRGKHPDDARAVEGLVAIVDDLSRSEPVEPRRAIPVWILLAAEVPMVLSLVASGKTEQAAKFLMQIWKTSTTGAARYRDLAVQAASVSPELVKTSTDWDRILTQVAAYQVELIGRLREFERSERGRYAIPLLMKTLDLSYDEIGRLFGVTGETARRWAEGSVRVPPEQLAKVDQAVDSLQRLMRMLKPGRLAEILRRPAEAFGGQRALDWILGGRIQLVADTYERVLTYQPD